MNAALAVVALLELEPGEVARVKGKEVYRSVAFPDRWVVGARICASLPAAVEALTGVRERAPL